MPQTMIRPERGLPVPARLDVQIEACTHDTVWVVDLASRRVIPGACMTCTVALGSFPLVTAAGNPLNR
jgi:hypothetical protein